MHHPKGSRRRRQGLLGARKDRNRLVTLSLLTNGTQWAVQLLDLGPGPNPDRGLPRFLQEGDPLNPWTGADVSTGTGWTLDSGPRTDPRHTEVCPGGKRVDTGPRRSDPTTDA